MNKKLQIFISSTYTDLIEERQSAVQAILDAGHIPAGMELFKAGKSQMKTICKWIDESDVYMLILGGRYGSIEEDSGKSFTQLEYEYALSKKMPVFAIVLKDNFLFTKAANHGRDMVFENKNRRKYELFKNYVESLIVKYVSNIDQISSVIHSQLNIFMDDDDYQLVGWIRADFLNSQNTISNNIEFNHLFELLSNKTFMSIDNTTEKSALEIFIFYYNLFCIGIEYCDIESIADPTCNFICKNYIPFFMSLNLIDMPQKCTSCSYKYYISEIGKNFYIKLIKNKIV